jgi:multidrug resistance efflux pump
MNNLSPLLQKALRLGATILVLLVIAWAGERIWTHYQLEPWTRDGRVRAEIISVAPDVSGLVSAVAVAHDQHVKAGQTLFTIDSSRYQLALQQADAAVTVQKAAIATQSTAVKVQQASIAARRASLQEAMREQVRNEGLGGLVAREQIEQSQTRAAEFKAALEQNQAALLQAEAAVAQAEAALGQAEAVRETAALNLERTEIRAPADGILSDVVLHVGDYAVSGKPALALIDLSSLRVEGYFEETKLRAIHVGQKARVQLMGEDKPIAGHVQTIASAIEDRERGPSANLLPNVNPTFSWVRLAQRIPVRIALEAPPADLRLIVGRTASVTILPESGGGK